MAVVVPDHVSLWGSLLQFRRAFDQYVNQRACRLMPGVCNPLASDLGPACTGTIGIATSVNINPDRSCPSLFEPVHGSAPDIADPIGQIWCASMMLDPPRPLQRRRSPAGRD